LVFGRRTFSNVREIRTHPHFPQQHGPLEEIIARRAAALAPFTIDVGRRIIGADLLAVAVNASVCRVNPPAALSHAGLRRGISIIPIFIHLRIEVSDLVIRDEDQTRPRKGEGAEDPEKERYDPFHRRA
jgi:hypothetical protein